MSKSTSNWAGLAKIAWRFAIISPRTPVKTFSVEALGALPASKQAEQGTGRLTATFQCKLLSRPRQQPQTAALDRTALAFCAPPVVRSLSVSWKPADRVSVACSNLTRRRLRRSHTKKCHFESLCDQSVISFLCEVVQIALTSSYRASQQSATSRSMTYWKFTVFPERLVSHDKSNPKVLFLVISPVTARSSWSFRP